MFSLLSIKYNFIVQLCINSIVVTIKSTEFSSSLNSEYINNKTYVKLTTIQFNRYTIKNKKKKKQIRISTTPKIHKLRYSLNRRESLNTKSSQTSFYQLLFTNFPTLITSTLPNCARTVSQLPHFSIVYAKNRTVTNSHRVVNDITRIHDHLFPIAEHDASATNENGHERSHSTGWNRKFLVYSARQDHD